MFCPKCGTTLAEGAAFCPKCGFEMPNAAPAVEVTEAPAPQPAPAAPADNKTQEESLSLLRTILHELNHRNPIARYLCFGMAVVVLVLFFIAASNIVDGGDAIMRIQSVGGKTLEEAYYQNLGSVYAGYAMACRAFGVFFASVLAWMGLKNK